MQAYFLRNLAEIAEKKAISLRQEAQLWDILSRDIKREAGRKEDSRGRKVREPSPYPEEKSQTEATKDKIFVRIPEAVKMMGISKSSLYNEIKAGNLRIKKSGRNTLIAVSDIKYWAEGLPAS